MRLDERTDGVSHKGDGINLEDVEFGIGNQAVVMKVIRDKMYSRPIYTACQEIMSNARDAHREVGTPDRPIEVDLPEADGPDDQRFIVIRDWGPGINPRRMLEVYIQYGNSTKREDEAQTGTYGFGAKSGWAYSTWFGVNTTAFDPDLQQVMYREYRAYVDDKDMGRLSLKEEHPCNSETPTGTEIVIPIDSEEDRDRFAKAVRDVADYWEHIGGVRPVVKGDFPGWTDFDDKLIESDLGWMVLDKSVMHYSCRRPMAVVDGIPYPIDTSQLRIGAGEENEGAETERIAYCQDLAITLFFQPGEVDLTATREAMTYTDKTVDLVLFRFNVCLDVMWEKLVAPIDKATDLWNAHTIYRQQVLRFKEFMPVTTFHERPEWNGHKLSSEDIKVKSDFNVRLYQISFHSAREKQWETKQVSDMKPHQTNRLVLDDTFGQRPAKSRLYTLFQADPNLGEVYVLLLKPENAKGFIDEMNEKIGLTAMNPVPLSTIPPTKLPRKQSDGTKKRPAKVFIFYDPQQQKTEWKPVEVDLAGSAGVYVVKYYNDAFMTFGRKREVDDYEMGLIADAFDTVIFGVVASQEKKIKKSPGWISLQEWYEQKTRELLADPSRIYWESEYKASDEKGHHLVINLTPKLALVEGIREKFGSDHPVAMYAYHYSQARDHQRPTRLLDRLRTQTGEYFRGDLSQTKLSQLTQLIEQKYPLLYASYGVTMANRKDLSVNEALVAYIAAVDSGEL